NAALVVEGRTEGGRTLRETLPARPEYLTVLTIDRPWYRPGLDTVRYRVLVLDRFTLRPAAEEFRLVFEITAPPPPSGPQGFTFPILTAVTAPSPVARAEAKPGPGAPPLQGVGAGDWRLDHAAPEGEYVLTVREENNRFPPQRRAFRVRHGSADRL